MQYVQIFSIKTGIKLSKVMTKKKSCYIIRNRRIVIHTFIDICGRCVYVWVCKFIEIKIYI